MRTFTLLSLFTLLVPASALALSYDADDSGVYTDTPFRTSEAAGIGLLTELRAVEGYPDGAFRPERTLNRAEFLKIVLLSHPTVTVVAAHADDCFPDVPASAWFSRYVCYAADQGIVKGYPDGEFKPANTVNYAEALKILSELYDYDVTEQSGEQWYAPYANAARSHGTELPVSLDYADALSRGQMARLAAAYRAEAEGELELYRLAEEGKTPASSSSSLSSVESSSSEESSEESSESSISSTSSSSSSSPFISSHILYLGQKTPPLAGGMFVPPSGAAYVRSVRVEFDREVESFAAVRLVAEGGFVIGTLALDTTDSQDKTWVATFPAEYELSASGSMLYVEADLRTNAQGGRSGELVEVRYMSVGVRDVDDSTSTQLQPQGAELMPVHQTSVAMLNSVENTLDEVGTMTEGANKTVAAFRFTGSGSSAAIRHLRFMVDASYGVVVNQWEIGTSGTPNRHSCARENATTVQCLGIPNELGVLQDGSRVLTLYGTVEITEEHVGQQLQVSLEERGTLGSFGSVRWTDGSTDFSWVELPEPIATGPLWNVEVAQ